MSLYPSICLYFSLFFPRQGWDPTGFLYISCSTFTPLSPFCSYSLSPGQSKNEVVSVQFLSGVHPVKQKERQTDKHALKGERERGYRQAALQSHCSNMCRKTGRWIDSHLEKQNKQRQTSRQNFSSISVHFANLFPFMFLFFKALHFSSLFVSLEA